MDMPLVDAKGVVYFAGSKGTIHAVDASGNEKWMLTLTPTPFLGGSPVMDAQGTLYFTTGSGVLFAVGDAP